MYAPAALYARGNTSQVTEGIELCQKYLPDLTPDDVVLDIGCGTGEITKYLAERSGATVTGIDSNPDMIQHAKLYNSDATINYELADLQVTVCIKLLILLSFAGCIIYQLIHLKLFCLHCSLIYFLVNPLQIYFLLTIPQSIYFVQNFRSKLYK